MRGPILLVVALSYGMTFDQGRLVDLQDLTVPSEQLPDGRVLASPGPVGLDGRRVRLSSLAGLGLPANPWIGSDRSILATIRERMDGHPLVPDAPLTKSEYARFRMRLADDAEEGYAAVYGQDEIVVNAARLMSPPKDESFSPTTRRNSRALHFTWDRIVAVVEGRRTPCFDAVDKHLRSLGS
jgi:hypothetical protein